MQQQQLGLESEEWTGELGLILAHPVQNFANSLAVKVTVCEIFTATMNGCKQLLAVF